MSTTYYPFRNTISSVRLAEGPGHDVLAVWQRGAKTGELVLTKGTGKTVMMMFRSEEPAFHATWGGPVLGTIVEVLPRGRELNPSDYVLSEYGELFTVVEVLKLNGAQQTS